MHQSPDMPRSLRIVIPAYNEEDRIGPTLVDYCNEFRDLATIVVVANGCSDNTAGVVCQLQSELRNLVLIDIPNPIGKGGAVRVGFATGSEEFVGFADADGSTSAREFKRLYATICDSGAEALVASRWLRESQVSPRQSSLRRIASRTFNGIVRGLFGLRINDTQCGAKLFRRRALAEVQYYLETAGFAFDIEILVRLQRSGRKIVEVPTTWSDRAAGSKINLLRSSWTMLKSVLRLRLRDTALWQVPLVDRFGRQDVIPVKHGRKVLVLGAFEAPNSADADAFFALLNEAGVEVTYAENESRCGVLSPLRAFWWYAVRSRRDYDAIMELEGRRSWIVPAFSSKPTFVVVTEANQRRGDRKLRGRAAVIDLRQQSAKLAVDTALATIYTDPHPAVFMDTPDALSLHYADRRTQLQTSQVLQEHPECRKTAHGTRPARMLPDELISIVMPAFNESEFIAGNLRETVQTFTAFDANFEVILVDDGSHDNTYLHALRVLVEHPERVRVLRYDVNQGKGNALMAGAMAAKGEYVVFLDADMDLHPSQLPLFFKIMRDRRADAVIGSKRHPQSQIVYPLLRKAYSAGYYTLVWLLFGLPLRDTQTGLKVFRAELLADVLPRVLAKRFAFDIEMLSIAHHLGYEIADAPVVLGFNRTYGRINYKEVWRIFLDTLAIFYRLRLLRYYDTKHTNFVLGSSTAREMSSEDAPTLLEVAD